MNKIVMATLVAFVAGSPLALAKTAPIRNTDLTTLHCTRVDQDFTRHRAAYGSQSAFHRAEDDALSLCRQSKDQDAKHASRTHEARGASEQS